MNDQLTIETPPAKSGPVECLGLYFGSDEARRTYFSEKLRAQAARTRELRKIDGSRLARTKTSFGFPIRPTTQRARIHFIEDFIRLYGVPYGSAVRLTSRKPLAADVSEGKKTRYTVRIRTTRKVLIRAIMRYILHYTEPGRYSVGRLFWTGMAGVAPRYAATVPPRFNSLGLSGYRRWHNSRPGRGGIL